MNCIQWNMDPVAFFLGPVPFTWYGISIGLLFIASYLVSNWQFNRAGIPTDKLFGFVFAVFGGAILGAFLFHRIFYEWDTLVSDPLRLFNIKGGLSGLASHGLLPGALIPAFFYYRAFKRPILDLMDRGVFCGALAGFFIRLGNLANSEIIGKPSDGPFAFCFLAVDDVPRHPSQLYESLIGLTVFGLLAVADRLAGKENRPMGFLSGLFLVLMFSLRFVAEFFKQRLTVGESSVLSMGQYLSLPFVVVGVGLMVYSLRRQRRLANT
ncbi:MAG: prolipoprotein diacylglyceryl transferase [Deltaproteobacteria bacterium]|nr:prolipoprotein diacylglyceryl transferase [Deltaproteobacteria bacterium]